MPSVYCSQGHENPAGHKFCALCGEKLLPTMTVQQGMVLGDRYLVLKELGHGGFGRTYLAEDIHRFKEPCVLKEFAPQVQGTYAMQKAEELFEREAGVLYRLRHPQIPQFREMFRANLGDHQNRLFLVQDYVEGKTYRQLLDARRPQGQLFSEGEIVQLLRQLLPVLQYIHLNGVIHRDISPDNLMLRYTDQLPVLIDFGGVKQVAAAAASEFAQLEYDPAVATRLGKVGYAPEEQMGSGRVFPHSDLYALGMTVLVLITGKEPSDLLAGVWESWQQQVKLTPGLQQLLERLLANHPSDRFQSATEVLRSLESPQIAGALPTLPPTPALPTVAATPPTPAPAFYPAPTEVPQPTAAIAPQPGASQPYATQPAAQPVTYPASPKPRGRSPLGAVVGLVLLAGVVGGGWWLRDRWLPLVSGWFTDSSAVEPGGEENPNFDETEQARKAALIERRETLGIDSKFLVTLTNATYYERYPEQQGRTLSTEPEDAEWRERWDAIATEWLDFTEQNLSVEARSQLGSYNREVREDWKRMVNQLNVGSRSLFDLTDALFFQFFPDRRGTEFIEDPIGQIWQAIAADQVTALQEGITLERIQFEQDSFSEQTTGTLQPGEGRVFIASLTEGQILRLNLQAPTDPARLSIYLPRPTAETPFLLEDSDQFVWSGGLEQTGFYEFVVVNNGAEPISFQLNLSVDNVTTTPLESPSPEAPEAKE